MIHCLGEILECSGWTDGLGYCTMA